MKKRRVTAEEMKTVKKIVCVWKAMNTWWVGEFHVFWHSPTSVSVWHTEDGDIGCASDFMTADSLDEALLKASVITAGEKIMALHTNSKYQDDNDWCPPEQNWFDPAYGCIAYEVTT